MTDAADAAKRFWSAAYFLRRAPLRDRSVAVSILRALVNSPFGPVKRRAVEILGTQNGE